jgi:hypothetical protein
MQANLVMSLDGFDRVFDNVGEPASRLRQVAGNRGPESSTSGTPRSADRLPHAGFEQSARPTVYDDGGSR